MVIDSYFLLFTDLHIGSPVPFIAFYPSWLQSELGMSVVTLMVGYILYVAGPLQMPILFLILLLIINILFSFFS